MSSHVHSQEVDVLVVGGGISGLVSAWFLAQKGLRVEVWEKAARPGGKIKTDKIDGFLTEQAASMIMNFKSEVDQFFIQTGLEKLKEKRRLNSASKRYLIHQGQLKPLPMSIGRLFLSPLWSHSGKFRLLLEPFIARSNNSNESVSDFIIRRFGREFLEKAMEPFVSGTLASDPDLACARQVLPRLTALEKRFGSISAGIIAHKISGKRTARNPEGFSFTGGMESIVQHLANDPAIGFQANTQVEQIIQRGQYHWQVQARSAQGECYCKARHVIIASPADSASKLIQPLNAHLSKMLKSIEYAPLSVVHIGLEQTAIEHPLDSAGFLVPRQENMTINGNLWMSSLFSGRAPENKILLSSYLGGSRHLSACELSTQASINRVLKDIAPLLGIKADPIMGRVDKHAKALPLYHGNYEQKIAHIENELKSLPGIHLEANYKGGVSVRDRIACAHKISTQIVKQLSLQDEFDKATIFIPSLIEKTA